MLTIKKTGEGYYLASLAGHNEALGRIECNLIKKEIRTVMKPHREVTINVKGIKSIDKRGFQILLELQHIADANRCKVRYINADPAVAQKLRDLTEKKRQQFLEI
jgi:ABC-type transporter Mla MlaB component